SELPARVPLRLQLLKKSLKEPIDCLLGLERVVGANGVPPNASLGWTVGEHGRLSRLTSRAQARGTKGREPRSGTESAIPRCLQRFDTLFKALVGFGYHLGRRAGSVTSTPRITIVFNTGSRDPTSNDRYEVLHFHHTIQLRN